jgi:DNA-binding transcriptional regulator GbsR (MarR family)
MCQGRVLNVIERSKKPLSVPEIAKKLKLSMAPVRMSTKKLFHYREIVRVGKIDYRLGKGYRYWKVGEAVPEEYQ